MAVKATAGRPAQDSVILATLKRGKHYSHFFEGTYHEFRRGVPEQVSEELADELEELVDTIPVGDPAAGEQVEVDRFDIDRDARPLEETEGEKTRRVLRLKVEEVPMRRRAKPVLKAPPKGFGRRTA